MWLTPPDSTWDKDSEDLVHMLVAETSEAEALEPRTLAEARRHPDWMLWEKAI